MIHHRLSTGTTTNTPLVSISHPLRPLFLTPTPTGAYGKFGPGQFSNLYSALLCPTADSRFHFVGEAVSAHHGWIVGALDSAHRAVINFLRRFDLKEAEDKLAKIAWLGSPPDELDKETAVKQVILGQVVPEKRMEARVAIENGKRADSVADGGS